MARVEVFDDAAALLDAAADAVAAVAAESIAARGRMTIALSGGSTPRGLYQRLAGAWRDRIDWTRVHVFWGDERCVPPTHADSNYRLARESLLDHVPVPATQIHRMPGDVEPVAAARQYAATLEATLGDATAGLRGVLDLVLLGLGADGHTASLFPGSAAVDETERTVVATPPAEGRGWRLTLTLPVLNAARSTLWLVTGDSKAPALAAVLENLPAPVPLPAQRVTGHDVRWLVDRAAARLLTGVGRP
jgi:6-phosphogluconolactonase